MSLSSNQEIALALIPIPSGLASAVCSSTLIHLCRSSQRRSQLHPRRSSTLMMGRTSSVAQLEKRGPYERLLMAMSACDIIVSLSYILKNFMVPASTGRTWAMGNDQTCAASGFFYQLSMSGMAYYTMLNLYFLLSIRFQYQDQQIARFIEPCMHVFSLGWPLTTATYGAVKNMYHPWDIGVGCWFNCQDGAPECSHENIGWYVAGIPFFAFAIFLVISNCTIFWHVRATMRRSRNRSSMSGSMRSDNQVKRIRLVATQCFLYVASFSVTYISSLVLVILGDDASENTIDENKVFWLLVVEAILLPLSGMFNLMIYLRPRYLQCRANFADQTKWWAVRRALFRDAVERQVVDNMAQELSPGVQESTTTDDEQQVNGSKTSSSFLQDGSASASREPDETLSYHSNNPGELSGFFGEPSLPFKS